MDDASGEVVDGATDGDFHAVGTYTGFADATPGDFAHALAGAGGAIADLAIAGGHALLVGDGVNVAAAVGLAFGAAVGVGFLFDATGGIDAGGDPARQFGAGANVFGLVGDGAAATCSPGTVDWVPFLIAGKSSVIVIAPSIRRTWPAFPALLALLSISPVLTVLVSWVESSSHRVLVEGGGAIG